MHPHRGIKTIAALALVACRAPGADSDRPSFEPIAFGTHALDGSSPGAPGVAAFDGDGISVRDAAADAAEVRLTLQAWGRADAPIAAGHAAPQRVAALGGAPGRTRVQYARPGVVEWWEERTGGFEQGFRVEERPSGAEPLVFDIAVSGAVAELTPEGAVFHRANGEPLRYSDLTAWDEGGRILPAWMDETAGGVRLVVDDHDAIGAITVDPLLTAPAWSREGDVSAANFGAAVSSAGDINGDGFGDALLQWASATAYTPLGHATLFTGSGAGLATSPAWQLSELVHHRPYTFSARPAGDVNGDGYDDVVVGQTDQLFSSALFGQVDVYFGSAAGIVTPAGITIAQGGGLGGVANSSLGTAVASAGDVNGDGYADVYVRNGTGTSVGALYLGAATPIWTAPVRTFSETGTQPGDGVGTAGDVNGDGYDDLIVGASGFSNGQTGEGKAYVYLGTATGLQAPPAWTVEANQAGAALGASVASAGDVNHDGFDDVIVGAPLYDNGQTDEGRAYVYLGSAGGLSTTPAWTVESDQQGAQFGSSVASAGDVNGDGYGDVIVGARAADNGQTDEGRATVYLGSASGLSTTPTWTAESDQEGAAFGASVSSAGDVNGDALDDVLVGAPLYDHGQTDEGRAYLYLGGSPNAVDADGDGFPAGPDCNDQDPTVHPGAVELCDTVDQDCDGNTVEQFPDTDQNGIPDCVDDDDDGDGDPDATDCAPLNAAIHHGATETCNGRDDDCNDIVDDSYAVGAGTWYVDIDADTFGSPDPVLACVQPDGTATRPGDCDDSNAAINPNATEICDGVDNDCDGGADDADPQGPPTDATGWRIDADHDSFGAGPIVQACADPGGFVAAGGPTDCDDGNPNVHPGATEIPSNNLDDDCDPNTPDQTDTDTDSDTDTDTDTDTNTDTDTDTDTDTGDFIGGRQCACSSTSPSNAWYALLFLVLPAVRRRRR